MEKWDVDVLHVEHETIDEQIDTLALACTSVTFDPAPDIAGERPSEGGCLIVGGCDPQALAGLTWAPTRVRFKARRYVEERLFEINNHSRGGADEMRFWLPSLGHARDHQTNASDGHVGAFPAFGSESPKK